MVGRRRTTPQLEKLKTLDDSPELTGDTNAATLSQKIKGPTKSMISPRIVTRARGKRVLKKADPIPVPESDDTIIYAIEAEPQTDSGVMSPKKFYSKKPKRSTENIEPSDVPAVKKSQRPIRESKAVTSKPGSKNCPEPNPEEDNSSVIVPKTFYSKTKQQSSVTKKNTQNKISPPPEALTVLKKENRVREPRMKTKTHMTTEEVLSELTNDNKASNLLPLTGKVDVAAKVNSRRIYQNADDDVSVKKTKAVKPANSVGNRKRKVNLSLEDIVNEVNVSPAKKKQPSESKVISNVHQSAVSLQKVSATKQKAVKKGRPKKVSDGLDEWDHSLLLITDDLSDSGNVYDFEEFQMGAAKSSSANNSSSSKSDKKKSMKNVAAMKAVMSKRKVSKELSSKKKTKKSTTKISKTTTTKKVTQKKVSPVTSVMPTFGSVVSVENPKIGSTIGSTISVENPNSSVNNCGISVSDDPFQTPSSQKMEKVSITELEKVKFTQLFEKKIVSKVNTGLAPDWPQLPDLPTQQFTKLKRCAMEGPTAADRLPENKPRSIMIKTTSAFNHSSLDLSSINAESPKKKAPKASSKKDCLLLTEKLSADNQPMIDLFTYPIAVPMKKKSAPVKKCGKRIEIKETPVKRFDFMYAGSVERYLKKTKDVNIMSPPAVMLPKFLCAETSTPNTMVNGPKSLNGEAMHISPVKDFQSPASMRTYDHKSRRSSASFLDIVRKGDLFNDEPKENSPQGKIIEKVKIKKKDSKRNKNFDEWANRMSNEFDECDQFELSIES